MRTSDYPKNHEEFKISVSFGQGNKARIPWIAILKEGQTVSEGVYPVYLYYKDQDKLLLCFGISETTKPKSSWNPKISAEYPTISQVINQPRRYGNSFVFKEYQIQDKKINLSKESVERDFRNIIELYRTSVDGEKNLETSNQTSEVRKNNILARMMTDFKNSGLNYNENLTIRLISPLCTKQFIILTGLSGSGKTKMAQSFAQWIRKNDTQVCLVPVGADWTSREPLLGYPNALEPGRYVKPENGVIDLLLEANKPENEDKPYFLILDEMNLSHVERYFADFLSAMESDELIPLHPGKDKEWDGVPSNISLPQNLFIIGTVNIDETTYMFSPKVLDRANVIEFQVSEDELNEFLNDPVKPDLELLKGNGSEMAADFVNMAKGTTPEFTEMENLNQILTEFFNELKKVGAEFGFRTAWEIYRFAGIINLLTEREGTKWALEDIADAAIIQKLLPKLHGSRRKLEPVLKILAELCLADKSEVDKYLNQNEEPDLDDPEKVRFPQSLDKIRRMYNRAVQDGFTSFAEA